MSEDGRFSSLRPFYPFCYPEESSDAPLRTRALFGERRDICVLGVDERGALLGQTVAGKN